MMVIVMSNVPKLRFKEFGGEWVEKQLSMVCGLKAGKFVRANEISEFQEDNMFPCYGGNGLRGYTKTQTHEGNYSLIGRQGALCGNLQFATGKFHATEHAVVVTPNEENSSRWLYYQLNKLNLNRYATGQAQPGLSVDVIEKVKSWFPSKQEQEKIASFLTSVDTKIEQLTKKEKLLGQYKKGVMQKIFNQEIRFKADNGSEFPEWEEKTFGEVFKRVTTKNIENNHNVLTISAQQGLINQEKYFNKSVSAKDVTGYYLLENGDFAYNKSYSKGYPMGAIKRLNNYDKGVVSTLYICFRIYSENDSNFYEKYFDSGFLNKELHKIAQEGARNHGLLNMSVTEFFNDIKVPMPSLKEQTKIANFLSSIDIKREQVQNQLKQTQEFKKALLQQMFV